MSHVYMCVYIVHDVPGTQLKRLWSLKAKCELSLVNSSINGSPLHQQTAAVAVNRNRNLTHSHSLTHTLTVYWLTKPDRSHWNVSASGHLASLSDYCDACRLWLLTTESGACRATTASYIGQYIISEKSVTDHSKTAPGPKSCCFHTSPGGLLARLPDPCCLLYSACLPWFGWWTTRAALT